MSVWNVLFSTNRLTHLHSGKFSRYFALCWLIIFTSNLTFLKYMYYFRNTIRVSNFNCLDPDLIWVQMALSEYICTRVKYRISIRRKISSLDCGLYYNAAYMTKCRSDQEKIICKSLWVQGLWPVRSDSNQPARTVYNLKIRNLFITICMLDNFASSFVVCCSFFVCVFFKIDFSKNSFRNTIIVSKWLDPDQARLFVGPDLGPNCLQRPTAANMNS